MDSKTKKRYAAAIKAMADSQGWQYLAEILKLERAQLVEEIIASDDEQIILHCRHTIKGIDLLFKKVVFYSSIETTKKEENTAFATIDE